MNGSIEVLEPVVDDRRVLLRLIVQGRRARRLVRVDFWSEYSFSPEEVPAQILTIPVVAHLLPLSWAEDFALSVSVLDRTYMAATSALRSTWEDMFPTMARGGTLTVDQVRETEPLPNGDGAIVLFGGGVDSVASALLHESERPTLCTVWGLDVALESTKVWDSTRRRIEAFARRHHASTEVVRTNAHSFLNRSNRDRSYSDVVAHWWRAYSGQGLLGMAAPVAIARGARVVYLPATHTARFGHPWGTNPLLDEAVRFGHVRCIHDGYHLSRVEKLRLIHDLDPTAQLAVCVSGAARSGGNCGRCEKCVRTASGLHLQDVDPRAHGVNVSDRQFDVFRRGLEARTQVFTPGIEFFWRDIQAHAARSLPPMPPRVSDFLLWLRDQDLSIMAAEWRYSWGRRARRFAGRLVPFRLRPLARRLYLALFKRW